MLPTIRHRLRRHRIEIKYIVITLAIMAVLAWLNAQDVLGGAEQWVNSAMDTLAEWGYPGLFVIGLLANITLVILIPYAIPLMTLAIYADSVLEVVLLGTAAGVGGGIGELISYAVAHTIVRHVDNLENSMLFRWTRRAIEREPRLIAPLVWLASATPLPDAVIVLPLAMVQYPWHKMIVPMIGGKIVQNVVMALVYRMATEQVERFVSDDINFDMTATLAIIFIMLIAYQVEKARIYAANANGPEE